MQTLDHLVRLVCLWIVSLLFDFVTKNLHLEIIFYHLVAVNFEPCLYSMCGNIWGKNVSSAENTLGYAEISTVNRNF